VIARALALNPSGVVVAADLPDRLRQGPAVEPAPGISLPPGDRPSLDELSRRYAALVLAECAGNKTKAAEVLGIDRKTLYRILGEGE
jgi:transcriptional regulator of acetoin/glycerol metabolism